MILVRLSRASSHELKTHLNEQAKAMAKAASKIDDRVAAKKLSDDDAFTKYYFGSWIPSTVHVVLGSPRCQTVAALSKRLGLSEKKVLECLQVLEQNQLAVRKGKNDWHYQGANFHLPKTSPLGVNHQIHNRLQAIKALQVANEDDLHVSAVFTVMMSSGIFIRAYFLCFWAFRISLING